VRIILTHARNKVNINRTKMKKSVTKYAELYQIGWNRHVDS